MNFDRDKIFSCNIKNAEINPDFFDSMLKQAEELRKRQEYFEKHLFIVGSEEVKRQLEEEIPGIKVLYDPSNTVPSDEIWEMEFDTPKLTFDIEEPRMEDYMNWIPFGTGKHNFGYIPDPPEPPSDEELEELSDEELMESIDEAIEDWYSNGDD